MFRASCFGVKADALAHPLLFFQLLDMWYKVRPDLGLAKALIVAVVKVEKWGPSQVKELWEHAGFTKPVWKSFTTSELGQVLYTAVKNERARSRSIFS